MQGESSGHDWWHIYRVWQTSLHIADREKVDSDVVQLAALLHDIGDWKFHAGDESVGPRLAREWLQSLGVEDMIVAHVCTIIANLSFKGADVKAAPLSLEGQVVQDADRLDAIGAIGIGRAFAYGGAKGREMHDPNAQPVMHTTFEQYKAARGTTINHFHEKLVLLKDRMNTSTARALAEQRHQFMLEFLEQFNAEWNING
ncbi:MAG: HD domain-containing protein [Anaerolineaceae bacterium]|nr:HD domain-containing protein [Anaerolineaceae bacterium]